MTIQEFNSSLTSPNPPAGVSVLLQALWLDAKGDWDAAHHLIDHLEEAKAYWVHAYLHRKEGDSSNAGYWYRRAARKMPDYSLQKEWDEIVAALL